MSGIDESAVRDRIAGRSYCDEILDLIADDVVDKGPAFADAFWVGVVSLRRFVGWWPGYLVTGRLPKRLPKRLPHLNFCWNAIVTRSMNHIEVFSGDPEPKPAPMDDAESRAFGNTEIHFGFYTGTRYDEISLEYLEWLADESMDTANNLKRYLASRRILEES